MDSANFLALKRKATNQIWGMLGLSVCKQGWVVYSTRTHTWDLLTATNKHRAKCFKCKSFGRVAGRCQRGGGDSLTSLIEHTEKTKQTEQKQPDTIIIEFLSSEAEIIYTLNKRQHLISSPGCLWTLKRNPGGPFVALDCASGRWVWEPETDRTSTSAKYNMLKRVQSCTPLR